MAELCVREQDKRREWLIRRRRGVFGDEVRREDERLEVFGGGSESEEGL